MELISEEEKKKEGKSKKIIITIIIALVVILVILLTAIFAIHQALDEENKLSIDGKKYKMPANFMISQENTTYLSINNLAAYIEEYKFYNGEYKEYTEDKTRGYVQCKDEVAVFKAGSNEMYKNNSQDNLNLDYFELELPIILYNSELYASINDIGKIFNSNVFLKQENNTLVVQTMPYLISYYKTQVKKYGYDDIIEEFNAQKAVNYGMLVVKKDNNYGVISTENYYGIIGTKYEKINFLESTKQFIVTSEGKTGLISADGHKIIDLKYDDVGLIDTKCGLYYAKNNDLMGVLNGNGKVVINIEYNSLGFDRKNFPYDNVKNNMFLYENCIPIMKYEIKTGKDKEGKPVEIKIEKWGLADKLGNILLSTQYDNIGYVEVNTSDRSINNAIIIPKIKGLVIGKGEKYGVVNSIGKFIIPCEFDKIYSITTEGKDEFYLEQDTKVIKLDKYITDNKIEIEGLNDDKNNTNTLTNSMNTSVEENHNTVVLQNGTTTTIIM